MIRLLAGSLIHGKKYPLHSVFGLPAKHGNLLIGRRLPIACLNIFGTAGMCSNHHIATVKIVINVMGDESGLKAAAVADRSC